VLSATPLDVESAPALTPTQDRAMTELFGTGQARPSFDRELGPWLRAELEARLVPVAASLEAGRTLSLNKGTLGRVHTCEGLWVAEQQTAFAWSAAVARGIVAHKAVELCVHLRDVPSPLDLVDLAIERIIEAGGDWGPRDWLLDAPAAELAELRGSAADWVVKFQDTFPPLRRSWRPRLESSLTVELGQGAIVLRGKVDLALGRADGTVAKVVIIDFKTGRANRMHIDDLRFYALLETIRVGVPPFRLATFSLDSGTWQAEDVDPDILTATVRRVAAGAAKLAELGADNPRPPVLAPGPACRWCPAVRTCPSGRRHLADADSALPPSVQEEE
jgi:PD-(D/E)XK nuclease superfamily